MSYYEGPGSFPPIPNTGAKRLEIELVNSVYISCFLT